MAGPGQLAVKPGGGDQLIGRVAGRRPERLLQQGAKLRLPVRGEAVARPSTSRPLGRGALPVRLQKSVPAASLGEAVTIVNSSGFSSSQGIAHAS